jgi:hypothetical protein
MTFSQGFTELLRHEPTVVGLGGLDGLAGKGGGQQLDSFFSLELSAKFEPIEVLDEPRS